MFLLASHFEEVTCMSSEGYVCWNPRYCNYKWINIRPSHHFQIYISSTMSRATALEGNTGIGPQVSPVWLTNWFWKAHKKQRNSCKNRTHTARMVWPTAKSNDGTSSTSSLQDGKETHLPWLPPIPNHKRQQKAKRLQKGLLKADFSFNILHVEVFICDLFP